MLGNCLIYWAAYGTHFSAFCTDEKQKLEALSLGRRSKDAQLEEEPF